MGILSADAEVCCPEKGRDGLGIANSTVGRHFQNFLQPFPVHLDLFIGVGGCLYGCELSRLVEEKLFIAKSGRWQNREQGLSFIGFQSRFLTQFPFGCCDRLLALLNYTCR